jgi:hypothetical protein
VPFPPDSVASLGAGSPERGKGNGAYRPSNDVLASAKIPTVSIHAGEAWPCWCPDQFRRPNKTLLATRATMRILDTAIVW